MSEKRPHERVAREVFRLARAHPALAPIREASGLPVWVHCHPTALWLAAVPRRDKAGAYHYVARLDDVVWEPLTRTHAREILEQLVSELVRQWEERGGMAATEGEGSAYEPGTGRGPEVD